MAVGCSSLQNEVDSQKASTAVSEVNCPIPWGRGKWYMIQGRQLMVPRRPSASSPSSPHPFRRHHNEGSVYLHGCSAAEALLISIMTVKNKCVSRGEIHGLLGGLMDAGNEPLMR